MQFNKSLFLLLVSLFLNRAGDARNHPKNNITKSAAAMFTQGTPIFSVDPAGPVNVGPSAVGVETTHAAGPSIVVTNTGTADLTITPSFSSIEFGFTAESLFNFPVTVLPGQNKTGSLLFLPHGVGLETAQFVSTDNAAGSPHTVQIMGTGVNVPANDFAVVLDPAVNVVGVSPGKTTTFTAWVLAGPGLGRGPDGNIVCSGGPSGTTCILDHSSFSIDNIPFDASRDSFVVSITIPARSSSLLQRPAIFWGSISAIFGMVFTFRRRRAARFFLVTVLLLVSIFLVSCGGSSTTPVNNGPLVLTASRNGATHTLNVTLNMQ